MATLETSLEANYDRRTPDTGQEKRVIGARATALPKKNQEDMQCSFYMHE